MLKRNLHFRKALKKELPQWQKEAIISDTGALKLARKYDLENVSAEPFANLLSIIYSVGAVLIGIGIISFVAYNWGAISTEGKVVTLFCAMLLPHLAGFYLWKINEKMPRLGHTLLLLGTLIYGANIGLMAQIFHIDGDSWRMFAAWSLGAAAMGYLVQSSPIMLISVVTLTISFFSHSSHDHIYFIFAGAVISLPFAYWKKDKLIFTAGLISMALFSIFALNDGYSLFSVTALIFLFLGFFASSNGRYDQFKKISLVLSFTAVTISAFFFSFQDVAEDMVYISETVKISSLLLLTSITLLAAGLVMLLAGWKKTVAEKFNRNNLIFLVICGIVPAISFFTVDFVLVVLSNVILIAVTGILIFNSMQTNARSPYWLGVSVLAATILARTVEYETGLLIKSAVFIATGIGFIIAGIIMEKYLKKRGATA